MAGLKFRVLLDSEKNEEIFRDIFISDTDNFESFFKAIVSSFRFTGDEMASFYVSNDSWDKGHEINLMDMTYGDDDVDALPSVMKDAIIKDFLEEPDQKFILVYDFMRMWIFLIELIGYDKNDPVGGPEVLLAMGMAPPEDSRIASEQLFAGEEEGRDDEDDFGFDDFDDDISEDDFSNFDDYQY
jgi:hypothetical protein